MRQLVHLSDARLRGTTLALIAAAGLIAPVNGAPASSLIEQPPGIPVPPQPGTPPGKGPAGEIPMIKPAQPTPGMPSAGKNPPGTNPGAQPSKPKSGTELEKIEGHVQDHLFHIGPFADPVKVKFLIDELLRNSDLKQNVIVTNSAIIEKEIYLTQEIVLPLDRLDEFLMQLLEQNGATLVKKGDLYYILTKGEIEGNIEDNPLATTQVIPTHGLRPSALQQVINVTLRGGSGGAAPGMPPQPVMPGGAGAGIAFLDDLGVIIMTDTPGRIKQVVSTVELLVKEQERQKIERFELQHVSAASARQRLTELLGGGAAGGSNRDPAAAAQAAALAAAQAASGMGGGSPQALSNIASRLVPDPKSNVLVFRGRPDETEFIRKLLEVIDTPNQLIGKFYRVGILSEPLALLGKREGLGDIVSLPGGTQGNGAGGGRRNIGDLLNPANSATGGQFQAREGTSDGGPMFVLDPDGRGFMYFGTEQQHARVDKLSKDFEPFIQAETPVFEFYKLKHAKAVDLANVVTSLLNNQAPSGSLLGSNRADRTRRSGNDSTGLGQGGNDRSSRRNSNQFDSRQPFGSNANALTNANGTGNNNPLNTELGAIQSSENVFVLADEANNQVVVKAPRVLQQQFAKLINRLDLRRPQVYIDAKILAITDNDDFRLAFETQIIENGDASGVVNSNFGLGSFGTNGSLLSQKAVSAGLGGLTAAIIRSDMVPIIITALGKKTDARILSTPQLLVDDNADATITSIDRVPTSASTVSNNTTLTTSGPDAEAGTTLTVTPRISEGGYLNLDYEIELSSFTGTPTSSGGIVLPPPSQRNTISSSSVTLPSDSTIVIGGLTFENVNSSVIKVPFLGDIPILGQLFKDDNRTGRRTTLYVFITPRVMRDPNFFDILLLTEGPAKVLKDSERTDVPTSQPAKIDIAPLAKPYAGDDR